MVTCPTDVPLMASSALLLRIEPDFRGFVLTELQKPAQTITKFSQALVIRLVKRLSGAHLN